MGFPEDKFGRCERCGSGGQDIDSDTGVATPFSEFKLKEYDGEWLCQLCINYLEDLKHAEIFNEKIEEEEIARAKAGFEKA